MIAGVGGASLGTEIAKSLVLAGGYSLFGCDIASTAFGLYDPCFSKTFRVDRDDYVASVVSACREAGAGWIVPGGEQPMVLLGEAASQLADTGISVAGNSQEVVRVLSDKADTFRCLADLGLSTPRTADATADGIDVVGTPCVVKPATGSGGSALVFFAAAADEALLYADHIRRTGSPPIVQEYVSHEEGEFTIGVVSGSDGRLLGSVAMQRSFESKLSVSYRRRDGLISSGYSQGYIAEFPDVCRQAEAIAIAAGSTGPINVQGRLRDGILIAFEINPRFSASTYLRALAGFNEVDAFLRYESSGAIADQVDIREGWYLRSLTERFVPGPTVMG
jgi:carbamoyl-phosphate synthase large subunit